MEDSREITPQIIINQNERDLSKGNYVNVPRLWVDELFGSNTFYPNKKKQDGELVRADRLPGSFIRYSVFLWRHITVPRSGGVGRPKCYKFFLSLDEFPVRTDDAVKWTAAYSRSGVIKVRTGKWTPDFKDSTEFELDPAASHNAWRAFVIGVELASDRFKRGRSKKKSEVGRQRPGQNTGAWTVLCAIHIDETRAKYKLAPVNVSYLQDAAAGRIKDQRGRPIAELKDGKFVPVFYEADRLRKPGESEEEFTQRLDDEYRWNREPKEQNW